ncbi:glycosyl hydrolase family protein [Marinomonas agarivorans]|nr:glycosyl hydrolase family protein [Marinomonas agarivorans]
MKKITLSLALAFTAIAPTWADQITSANVMAPLSIDNAGEWADFQNRLFTAKNMGVDAVSVDVWWGRVEGAGDQIFDWSYYDTILNTIETAGLKWVPIISFHQCGGNVGDDCNIPIPNWIWNHYNGVNANDLKYQSEQGNYSVETVSLWADDLVLSEYTEFLQAFETKYGNKASIIQEINISMGPAGELRYPSYNSHDSGTGYPTRGAFQAYGTRAVNDFRNWLISKYGSLNGINQAWGTALTSSTDINPPSNADFFINQGDQYNTAYGKDFIRWYHESLVGHGNRMLDNADAALTGAFASIPLGFKIPGIHWKMGAPDNTKRSAEMAAGLIPADINLDTPATSHGYDSIIGVAAAYNNKPRHVILHFTALEMNNDNNPPQYSKAKDLVFWVANGAEKQGVEIKGENALAGGVASDNGWDNITNAFTFASYTGMTVLRVGGVTSGGTGQSRYTQFISDFRGGSSGNKVTGQFTCSNGSTYFGQSVYAIGNVAELGNWNIASAIKLDPSNYPTWTGTIDLPANTNVEWKCLKRDENNANAGVVWQSGSNNSIQTGNAGSSVSTSGGF